MWKLPSSIARSMLFCSALVGTGCPATGAQVIPEPTPIQTKWVLLPIPSKDEKISLDTVVIGNVGRPIGRDDYSVPLEFSQPMQLRCLVSYRPLDLQGRTYSTPAELNFIIAGPGNDRTCKETPLLMSKQIDCSIMRKGLARVVLESANPQMALGFGFVCSQLAVARVPEGPPPGGQNPGPTTAGSGSPRTKVRPERPPPAVPPLAPAAPPISSAPPPAALTMQLDAVDAGRDDQHKILTLLPCDKPLLAGAGKVVIGKSGRLSFTVHDAKNCKIEVANVAEELLGADTKVLLTPAALR